MPRYSNIWNIRPCKLNKDDLSSLISIITEGFSSADIGGNLKINAEFGITEISSNNLNEIFDSEEIPDTISKFSIRIFGNNNSLSLRLGKNYNDLYLSSNDKTWFHGKAKVIIDFLKKKQQFFWFTHAIFPFMLGLFTSLSVFSIGYFFLYDNRIYLLVSILFLVVLLYTTAKLLKGTLLNSSKIVFRKKDSALNKENVLIITNILILIVMIYGLIQSILKF